MRLTKTIKDKLFNRIMETYENPANKLKKQENDLADRIYNHIMSPYLDKVSQLPAKWFDQSNSITVYVKWNEDYWNRNSQDFHFKDNISRVFPRELNGLKLSEIPEFSKEILSFKAEKQKLDENKANFSESLKLVLESCQTDKELTEIWPKITKVANIKITEEATELLNSILGI